MIVALLWATAGLVSLVAYVAAPPPEVSITFSSIRFEMDHWVSELALPLGTVALAWLLATTAAALIVLERPSGHRLAWVLVLLTSVAAVYPETKLGWALRVEAAVLALALALELRGPGSPSSRSDRPPGSDGSSTPAERTGA